MRVRAITNEIWHEVYGQVNKDVFNLVDRRIRVQVKADGSD